MRWIISIFMVILPVLAQTQTITLSVPSAVAGQIDVYRSECSNDGGELELDGDEVFKVWTDEGEEAYVIYAAFTCGNSGHLWCGSGGCSTQLLVGGKLYETSRILSHAPNRISQAEGGSDNLLAPR